MYLKNKFPQLQDCNFANSRDVSFEDHIKYITNGRGCDIVLNSLADEKLQASLRCVAEDGCFLEIGKYDLAKNTSFGMGVLLQNISVHGILLDTLLRGYHRDWDEVAQLFQQGLDNGTVQPLSTMVFTKEHIEDAFRFMTQGKHIGKVMIKVW